MAYAVVILSATGAGVIQSVTGFGAGVFMMLFFPLLFPVLQASGISASICMILNAAMAWRYRKYVNMKQILIPAVFYVILSSVSIFMAPYVPKDIMLKILGVFLIALSIYFLFFPDKIKVKASFAAASACASLSGLFSGLFGIGGPPMAIYYLAATNSKEEYLGTIQFFFTITSVYSCSLRFVNGIYGIELVPMTLIGTVGILLGKSFGQRIIDKIDVEMMKKIIYVFLGISGILNLR